MLEVLVLAMTIMQEETAVFGLRINWKIIFETACIGIGVDRFVMEIETP